MHNTTIIKQNFQVSYNYPIYFSTSCFAPENNLIIDLIDNLDENPKILPVIDSAVLETNPKLNQQLVHYFKYHQLDILETEIVPGGEAVKNDPSIINRIHTRVETDAIDRHSYILVIGGGAVVDAIGYAAATAHRGIRLIRMPSTVLGQNDAGVGVKNAVNFNGRKNFLGTFVPPHAVVNDFSLLNTLQERDKRSGISEAIKVALIKDTLFFNQLYQERYRLAGFEEKAMQQMIIKGAQWHLNHIATNGDPFEYGSARPLDFGHWSAHKLEELSNNELRHGEAVAIGIALDSIYSNKMKLISENDLIKILTLLIDLGFELNPAVLTKLNIKTALCEFKEHLGGNLCITLLNKIGEGFEVNEIDEAVMQLSLLAIPEYLNKLSNLKNKSA